MNGHELMQQEEEFRLKFELEEEERKLEETLEYQRQMENEAKQKQLAEQHKKSTRAYTEKVAEGLHDVYLKAGADDQHVHEKLKPCTQVKTSCFSLSCLILNRLKFVLILLKFHSPWTIGMLN